MLATLFPTLYGNVTAPAVLEIEAAEPVAVSAALLIHAPPVTTRPAAPAATLPASRFSGWRDCHRNHAPATKQISAPTYIAVEAAKPPAVENSCAMVWTCAPIVPPAACAKAALLATMEPPSPEAPTRTFQKPRERAFGLMNERCVTSLLQGLNQRVECVPPSPREPRSSPPARTTTGKDDSSNNLQATNIAISALVIARMLMSMIPNTNCTTQPI